MQPFNVPAGAKVYFGAPANPMPKEIAARIARVVGDVPDVVEAHLPQFYTEGAVSSATQILVLGVKRNASLAQAARAVSSRIGKVLPAGAHLDVWPMTEQDAILATVRSLGCQIR